MIHNKFSDLVNKTMSKDAQRKAHQKAQTILAEMELAELRKTLKVHQSDLAKKLKVTQAAISRLERRPNVLLETLSDYIGALGGQLELHAKFPHRTVKLTHLVAARKKTETAARK
jgi:transcriptional regulator with XRE-family HTH domain